MQSQRGNAAMLEAMKARNASRRSSSGPGRSSGGGMALPLGLQDKFGAALGADVSGVRVHQGPAAATQAEEIGAKAFAVGQDVYFNAGRYSPGDAEGERLLAHEVAHTVQQSMGNGRGAQTSLEVSEPGDRAEVDADRAARAMVSGQPFQVGAASMSLARSPDPASKGSGEADGSSKKDGEKTDEKDPNKKKRYPSWKDGTWSVPLGPLDPSGTLAMNFSDPPTSQASTSGAISHDLIDKSFSRLIPVAGPFSVDLSGGIKGGIGVSSAFSMSGFWEVLGPRKDGLRSLTTQATGGGKVSTNVTGTAKLGAAVGAPYFALAGGGALTLGMNGDIGASLTGGFTRSPEGDYTGKIVFLVEGNAKIEGTGALYFDAILPTDRHSLGTWTLDQSTFGTVSIKCPTVIDPGTGQTSGVPQVTAQWKPPTPKKVCTRKLTEEERQQYLPVNQGASGAPPSMANVPRQVATTCPTPAAPASASKASSGGSGGAPAGNPAHAYRDPNKSYADTPAPTNPYQTPAPRSSAGGSSSATRPSTPSAPAQTPAPAPAGNPAHAYRDPNKNYADTPAPTNPYAS